MFVTGLQTISHKVKVELCFSTNYKKLKAEMFLPERKETAQRFHNESNGDFKTVTALNGCDMGKPKMHQQHCSYYTILT